MGKDLKGKELGQGLSQRKDGRYCARYTDRFGKRKCIYRKKLIDIKRALNEALYENAHYKNIAEDITVDTWFDIFLNVFKVNIRDNTKSNYKTVYQLHFSPRIGFRKMKEITIMDMQSIINELGKTFKESSLRTFKSTMSCVFNVAVENQYLTFNPMKGVKIKKQKQQEQIALTVEEQEIFLEATKHEHYHNTYVCHFNTGLRSNELFALTIKDIDFTKKEISVNKVLNYYSRQNPKFKIEDTKTTSSNRIVPMNRICQKALKEQIDYRKKCGALDDDYLFVTSKHNPINKTLYNTGIQHKVKVINQNAGAEVVRHFSSHSIRHTFATRCFERDVSAKAVQKLLGHSSIRITMDIYTHVTKTALHDAVQKLA